MYLSEDHAATRGRRAPDVLLIADDPRAAGPTDSIEPLDMETVVRKLIAALREESET